MEAIVAICLLSEQWILNLTMAVAEKWPSARLWVGRT